MKNVCLLGSAIALSLLGCAFTRGDSVSKAENFQGKTGIIGVFRQPAYYCGEGIPHTMVLGGKSIIVKPAFSSEQENVFFSEMKPGVATLTEYNYTCGENENKMALDTVGAGNDRFPTSVVIPEKGFCKVVISFLENDNLFSHNDPLLKEYFEKNQVAAGYPNIPYCDIIDTKGSAVTFMDRDSLYREQFAAAVKNAKSLTADDIFPLVSIDGSSDMAQLSGDNSQVVLVTWHNNPDAFKDGETISHTEKVIWAFTDKEFIKWFRENHTKVDDWDMRLKQLIGMSPESDNNYFTVFWANVTDVFRPAYYPEINSGLMNTTFSNSLEEDTSENAMWFKNWFDKMSSTAYTEHGGHPWTRLGYTYDWGNPSSKYGLSEFIVKEGAPIEVKFTRKNKAFLTWIKDRAQ